MSQAARIIALAQAIGADIKAANVKIGDLTALPTTAKTNLVAAIAEIYGLLGSGGVEIDDTAGNGDTDVVWSADKVYDTIEAAKLAVKNEILNGAGAALDTLKELADALNNDPNFAATIATALGFRLRFDEAQVLTTAQKLQGCTNLGIGDPETDLAAAYIAAKA